MSWIRVVYFELKKIWPLFSPAKAKTEIVFYVINVPVLYPYVPAFALLQPKV